MAEVITPKRQARVVVHQGASGERYPVALLRKAQMILGNPGLTAEEKVAKLRKVLA